MLFNYFLDRTINHRMRNTVFAWQKPALVNQKMLNLFLWHEIIQIALVNTQKRTRRSYKVVDGLFFNINKNVCRPISSVVLLIR